MINEIYQLTAPRYIEGTFEDLTLTRSRVLIRPAHLSICKADQRYYQGSRPKAVLEQKLPMALIHECIATVEYDPTGTFPAGSSVIPIPNTPVESDPVIAENYLRSSKFRSSGFDGFMQDYVLMDPERLVAIDGGVNTNVAAFTELISVCMHVLTRMDRIAHARRDRIGVWGDGNLGFITSVLLKSFWPDTDVFVFGRNYDKLSWFSFADGRFQVDDVPKDLTLDHCIECVGGAGAENAIEQMIALIEPEGTMALTGVSENNVPINTRMVLEKGLRLFGSSRSGRADFEKTVAFLEQDPNAHYLQNLVGAETVIRSIPDIHEAFNADLALRIGKTVLHWEL